MRNFYFTLICLLCYSTVMAADFGNISFGYAINLASKQRMLSQRITKTALLKANQLGSESLDMDLRASVTLFEANHNILYHNAKKTHQKFIYLLDKEESTWKEFMKSINEFDGGQMISLLAKSNDLLNACHKIVLELEAEANFTFSEYGATEDLILQTSTINTSGKQRMLSQKFSVNFLAAELYGMQEVFETELNNLRQEQRDDLSFLIFNSLNDQAIEDQFIEITLLFELLDKYRSMHSNMSLLKIVSFCDRISNIYDEITHNYTKLYEDINTNRKKDFSSLTSTNK